MRNKAILLAVLVLFSSLGSIAATAFAAEEFSLVTNWGSYGTIDGKLRYPQGIAVDSDGNVYVADTGNNRVQKFSENGALLTMWGSYGIGNGTFNSPQGIAVDSNGNVYVADTGNNRVQKFSSNGTFLLAWGSYGAGNGKFGYPNDVAVDPSSNEVYVADTLNNRIQKFAGNGTFIASLGSMGVAEGKFRYPRSIAVDSTGDIYVADTGNNRIQKFSRDGTFLLAWGSYGTSDGMFNSPRGIAIDSSGSAYVADTLNNRIQKFAGNGTFIAKEGAYGKKEGLSNQLSDIAVDSQGNIFVTDMGNNRVSNYIVTEPNDYLANVTLVEGQPFVRDSNLKVETVAEGLKIPTNIAFLSSGDILVLQKDTPGVSRVVNGDVAEDPVLELDLGGQFLGCMCGIAVAENGNGPAYVFLYYYILKAAGDNPAGAYLYRYELVNNEMINPKLLLFLPTSENAIHLGGEVIIGPDNNVYLVIGNMDGHKTKAQNYVNGTDPDGTSSIIRINQNGEAIVDEGSLGSENPLNMYYAYGIRNSFGIDFDPVTGKLWDTENGPAYGDEINLVEQGFNSGFEAIQGISSRQEEFDSSQLVDFGGKGKYRDPEFEWANTIGPTAIKFLDSSKVGQQYENDMFVGDINNGNLYHFDLNENRTGLALNGALADKFANNILERDQAVFGSGFIAITDIQTGPDGYLYVVSLGSGKIYRIVPVDMEAPANE